MPRQVLDEVSSSLAFQNPSRSVFTSPERAFAREEEKDEASQGEIEKRLIVLWNLICFSRRIPRSCMEQTRVLSSHPVSPLTPFLG
jgi:hypothetical protein